MPSEWISRRCWGHGSSLERWQKDVKLTLPAADCIKGQRGLAVLRQLDLVTHCFLRRADLDRTKLYMFCSTGASLTTAATSMKLKLITKYAEIPRVHSELG